jgi:hypothetical protein
LTVDAGPDRELDARASLGQQDPGRYEVVERRLEVLERGRLADLPLRRMLCGREGRVEKAGLRSREPEVGLADRPHPQPRTRGRMSACAHLVHPVGHAVGQLPHRLVADRRKQRVPMREMPVGRVRDDADHARHLAQHDGVRAARACQFEARGHERIAGLCSSSRHRCDSLVDSVHLSGKVDTVH